MEFKGVLPLVQWLLPIQPPVHLKRWCFHNSPISLVAAWTHSMFPLHHVWTPILGLHWGFLGSSAHYLWDFLQRQSLYTRDLHRRHNSANRQVGLIARSQPGVMSS